MDLVLLQGAAPIPITGYLVCFAPLAAVILGLIVLFAWTDRHASRPYLRLNPFPKQERKPGAAGGKAAGGGRK